MMMSVYSALPCLALPCLAYEYTLADSCVYIVLAEPTTTRLLSSFLFWDTHTSKSLTLVGIAHTSRQERSRRRERKSVSVAVVCS